MRGRVLCISAQECEGDDRVAGFAGLGEEFFFEFVGQRHFAGGDLVVGGSDEAELTAGESIAIGDAHGRTEDAACHGAEGVDVAQAGFGIEGGTGCVVGEIFETGLVFFGGAENAGCGIAGEVGTILVEPDLGAAAKFGGGVWIGDVEGVHAGLEAGCVEPVDGEGSVTTLGAPGAAGEHGAGATGGIRECGVHDLDQFGVAGGERHTDSVSENVTDRSFA